MVSVPATVGAAAGGIEGWTAGPGGVPIPPAVPAPLSGGVSAATLAALADAVPSETRRAFQREWDRFSIWCARSGRRAMPADDATLVEYVGAITATSRYAVSTVERMVTAIRAHHRAAGEPPPDSYAVRKLISAYRSQLHEEHHPVARPRRAEPVTPARLQVMLGTLDMSTAIGARDRAVLTLGFAVAGRRGELARLNIENVRLVDEGLDVDVWRPKTNRDGPVAVPRHKTNLLTCPVRAMARWLDVLAEDGRTEGPLFVRIDRHGNLAAAMRRNGSPIGDPEGRLSDRAVANIVARTARAAGLAGERNGAAAPRWSGHGLRRGMVTAARRAGRQPEEIGRQGGWADGSRSLLIYVAEEDRWIDNVLEGLE